MLGTDPAAKVYLAAGVTDMRKSIDGLAVLVADVLGQDPLSRHFFAFCNRGRDKIKILQWTGTGFWLHYKRIDSGRFHWPAADTDRRCVTLTRRELEWLLEGLSVQQPRAHQHLGCDRVC
jgi:transposase